MARNGPCNRLSRRLALHVQYFDSMEPGSSIKPFWEPSGKRWCITVAAQLAIALSLRVPVSAGACVDPTEDLLHIAPQSPSRLWAVNQSPDAIDIAGFHLYVQCTVPMYP